MPHNNKCYFDKDEIHLDTITIEMEEINENCAYKGIRLHVTARLDTASQKIAMDIGVRMAIWA